MTLDIPLSLTYCKSTLVNIIVSESLIINVLSQQCLFAWTLFLLSKREMAICGKAIESYNPANTKKLLQGCHSVMFWVRQRHRVTLLQLKNGKFSYSCS